LAASNREAFAWVVDHMPISRSRIRVAACHSSWQLEYFSELWPNAKGRFEIVREKEHAQIFLATTRDNCFETPGKLLYSVQRQGVALLHVLER
jgi:hypothetical protein